MGECGCAFFCFVVNSHVYNGPVGAITRLYTGKILYFLQVTLLINCIGKLVI
jgi:hypothetical protein